MSESRKTASRRGQVSVARVLIVVGLLAAWAFVFASLIGFNPADPPTHAVFPPNSPVANWCGPAGAFVAYHAVKLLGAGAWVITVGVGLGVLAGAAGQRVGHPIVRLLGLSMLAVAVAGYQRLLMPASGALPDLSGGVLGTVGSDMLTSRFGGIGAGLWLGVLLAVGAVVAADDWLRWAFGWMHRHGVPVAKVAGVAAGGAAVNATVAAAGVTRKAGGGLVAALAGMLRGRKPIVLRANDIDDDEAMPERAASVPRAAKPRTRVKAVSSVGPELEIKPVGREAAPATAERETRVAEAGPEPSKALDEAALREKISRLPIMFGQRNKSVATEDDLRDVQNVDPEAEDKYQFPSLELLENPEENFSAKLEHYVREQATALESALQQYRINGEVVGIESGPVITLHDVKLAPGTKVAQVEAVESDIARALKAVNIRIVANQIGRDTIGIEVPNLTKEKVRLKELMGKRESFARMKLPMFLGKDASGDALIADLAQMPHMLIAGTTGSGKSVCINTIIMGFLYTKKPSELKMVLVDPKMVELSQFKSIPHLMCPVVTEVGKAAAILEWATTKMDERYELLAEAGCRDIAAYNDLPWEELKVRMGATTPEEEARIPRKLPYMVFIIDELADLIITTKEVEGSIIRIAQKARAVGIHLILATQRPQANVVTGLIKSNMPCRVAFKVASGMDSRIVLDQKGGELLLGMGDMLYLSPRTSKLMRAQGTLVDDGEIRRVVTFMREVAAPSFERQLLQIRRHDSDQERLVESENNSSASLAAAQEDPMFTRAVEIVLETKRGSVSLLQRRLAIGYTRASRLIDLMGIAGIISDHKGSVARDVLISPEEWAAMKEMVARDQEASQSGLFNKPAAAPFEPDRETETEIEDDSTGVSVEATESEATDRAEAFDDRDEDVEAMDRPAA